MAAATDIGAKAREIASSCACMKARQTARSITRLYDELLRPSGLQTSQLTVVVAVAHWGERGAPFGKVADALGMDRSTLTRNLLPLERDGLLRVARDPADGRQRVILLTRDGERVIERAFPLWQKAQARVVEMLGARDTAALASGLDRARKALATPLKRARSARSSR